MKHQRLAAEFPSSPKPHTDRAQPSPGATGVSSQGRGVECSVCPASWGSAPRQPTLERRSPRPGRARAPGPALHKPGARPMPAEASRGRASS